MVYHQPDRHDSAVAILYGSQIFCGASTIAIMILRSPQKLTTPFRRIIFGLSIGDILQSLSSVIGPMAAAPSEDNPPLWGIGNQASCDAQGFMIMVGGVAVASYTLLLCIFYLHVVKYNMSDQDFSKKIEPKLQAAAIIYSFSASTFYLVNGDYNNVPDGNMCFVANKPHGCHRNPDIECERGENATDHLLYLTFIPIICVCMGIMYALSSLYRTVKAQEMRLQRSFQQGFAIRNSVTTNQGGNDDNTGILSSIRRLQSSVSNLRRSTMSSRRSSAPLSNYMTRGAIRARERSRETLIQAILYVGSYSFVYGWPLISYLGFYRAGNYQPLPLTIVLLEVKISERH